MELKFSPSVAQIQKVSYAKEAEEKYSSLLSEVFLVIKSADAM